MDAATARTKLAEQGIPYTEDDFLRCVRGGRAYAVELFISAGVSANAVRDDETAVQAAARGGHVDIVRMLLAAGADSASLVDAVRSRGKPKDVWEKVSSLGGLLTFASGVVIAAVGWYFTNSYNNRQIELATAQAKIERDLKVEQNRLAELQNVEKMIPHLLKDERSKQAALLAISVLASPTIASRMAELFGGQGSVNALTQIAAANEGKAPPAVVSALTGLASRKEGDAKPAENALATVLAGREKAIVRLRDGVQPRCNGFVADARDGWIVTPAFCLEEVIVQGRVAQLAVMDEGNKALAIKSAKLSADGFVGLIQVEARGLTGLGLSPLPARPGEAVIRFAYDMGRDAGPGSIPTVGVGRVVSVGTAMLAATTGRQVEGPVVTVVLPLESVAAGSGGSPLLDREGNVTCMTYQSDGKGTHQCLPASIIGNALAAAKRVK